MVREKAPAGENYEIWRVSFREGLIERFPALAAALAKPDAEQLLRSIWEVSRGEICCTVHPLTRLVCPRCIAAKGGNATANKYDHDTLARWGRKGGRPKTRRRKKKKSE
jgi:hypothetical protein